LTVGKSGIEERTRADPTHFLPAAVLAAGAPHLAPFMADECLLAMPDGESLDYTMKEYMRFVEYVQNCVERLTKQGKSAQAGIGVVLIKRRML
jgi:hypothetical protein